MFRLATNLAVVAALITGGAARAEDAPPPVPIIHVELQAHDKVKAGKVAAYEGEADDQGIVFMLDGLSILTPVMVVLEARDPAEPMTLELKNDLSMQWDRTVKTTSKGAVETRFRTEGPAAARVRTSGGRKAFRIAFWVGPELKLHTLLPPPFAGSAPTAGGGKTAYIVVPLVLVAVAILGFVAVRSRRKRGSHP